MKTQFFTRHKHMYVQSTDPSQTNQTHVGWVGLGSIHVMVLLDGEFFNPTRSSWVEKPLQPNLCTSLVNFTTNVLFSRSIKF